MVVAVERLTQVWVRDRARVRVDSTVEAASMVVAAADTTSRQSKPGGHLFATFA